MSDLALPSPVLARLDRLERENRRFKLAGGAATLLVFTWSACSLSSQVKNEVAAERFVLRAADGSEQGWLGLDAKGYATLYLTHENARAVFTTNGPGLLARGPDGKTGAFIGIDTHNASKVELCSSRILDGVRLSVQEDGSSGVYVLDATGRERAGLEALSVGGASLNFRDPVGRVRSQMGLDPKAQPNLILLDADGGRRMGMLVQEDGNPLLELEDQKGQPRALLSTLFDGSPHLELRREDGAASFQAP